MSCRKKKVKSILFISVLLSLMMGMTILTGCTTASVLPEVDERITAEQPEIVDGGPQAPPGAVLESNEGEPQVETNEPSAGPETSYGDGDLIVEFIDVGQGDSILIKSPDGKVMLIDAGDRGNFNVIKDRLDAYRVSTIDVLIATHPHADHIGSMQEVVENYDIGEIYMPDIVHDTKTFENLLVSIDKKGYGVNTAQAGMEIPYSNGVKVDVLSPVGNPRDLNDYSIVLYLTFEGNSFLFAGDMESSMEKQLGENLRADVLKVGHHGSTTSSSLSFLEKVKPKHSVISVGAGNKYGHPDREIISRLDSVNSRIYRTEESGTILMHANNGEIKVSARPSAKDLGPIIPEDTGASNVKPITPSPEVKPVENKPAPAPIVSGSEDRIVFKTKTGEKYHLDGCRSLSQSKIETTIEKAKAAGLKPCGVCHPGE